MVDTAWTFTVLFMAIFVLLIVFGVLWLISQRSTAEHLPSDPSVQQIRVERGLARGEVRPDQHQDSRDELEDGAVSSGAGRPAELVHK
jgi:uncharacterized membrane protein